MMNMRKQPAGLSSFSPNCKSLDALMPHTPVCNEMHEAGSLNPAVADRIGYTHECNLKLAVTMLNPKSSNVVSTAFQPVDWLSLIPPPPRPQPKLLAINASANGYGHSGTASKTEKLICNLSKIQRVYCVQMVATSRDHELS